tara:strand:- start:10606 stop:12492 length:1887 start_codon:yes stop_codon:yes gene_type:complete
MKLNIHRKTRKNRLILNASSILLFLADIIIIKLAINSSLWVFSDENISNQTNNIFILIILLLSPVFYYLTGQYKVLLKYIISQDLYLIIFRNILLLSLLFFILGINKFPIIYIKIIISTYSIAILLESFFRLLLRDLLLRNTNKKTKVAIFGAGEAGAQLATSLRLAGRHKIVCFLDDNKKLWGKSLSGIAVKKPTYLRKIKEEIDQIFLAIPSLNSQRRYEIINYLSQQDFPALQVPSINELTAGQISTLNPISIEELLSRKSIPPNKECINSAITKKTICVTGAAGSIGSEICRQILDHNPKRLILLENSEPSLYNFLQELIDTYTKKECILSVLGSACDPYLLKRIFTEYNVDLVFHAAAYKHVPLVEINPVQGLNNNISSTLQVCNAAIEASVSKVILISSDKAVRPTNVMGASKRVAEMIVQGFHQKSMDLLIERKDVNTIFSMVRFGNVLGSSGSVVPLFKKQISKGGPITLTHPDIIRYFMTIQEAAQLVIQASSLAEGGEVFLLDMGEPVKIIDLAKKMINLSGLKLKDKNHNDGDIEIITTKLRPGEKLYEELLIDAKSIPTKHPLIFKANEKLIPLNELWANLELLKAALSIQDKLGAFKILSILVPEWKASSQNESD